MSIEKVGDVIKLLQRLYNEDDYIISSWISLEDIREHMGDLSKDHDELEVFEIIGENYDFDIGNSYANEGALGFMIDDLIRYKKLKGIDDCEY